jgi:hypothetical protein
MKLATRYGLAGIGGLTLLSLGHWLREGRPIVGQPSEYLLGVLPNFAASIAVAFVLLSIWTDRNSPLTFEAARHRFLICATVSGVGLVAWEFVQLTGDRLVFDLHDISATGIGLCAAGLLFLALTPKTMDDEAQNG